MTRRQRQAYSKRIARQDGYRLAAAFENWNVLIPYARREGISLKQAFLNLHAETVEQANRNLPQDEKIDTEATMRGVKKASVKLFTSGGNLRKQNSYSTRTIQR